MLDIGIIALTVTMITIISAVLLIVLGRLGYSTTDKLKKLAYFLVPISLWFVYIYWIQQSGFLNSTDLPPRFPIFTIFPLFGFTVVFLYKYRNHKVLSAIPKHWAVYYQTFRIAIESIFVGLVAQELLPEQVTLLGYNYDFVFACTAPLVGFLVFGIKILPTKFALAWNYLGLAVIGSILFLFTTVIFFPGFWGSAIPLLPPEDLSFTFLLVAGFLMPSAVFMHVLSIIQLSKEQRLA